MSDSIKRNYLDSNKTAWTTPDGTLHLDAVKLCEVLGLEPTAENQDMVEVWAIKFFQEQCPDCQVRSADDLL